VRHFRDEVSVVTGAASGIGRQLALDLVARGAKVYGVDVQDAALKSVPGIIPKSCDLADLDAYVALLKGVESENRRIDILANVAGIDRPVSVVEDDFDVFSAILQVNYLAPLRGTLAVLSGMVERRHGYVVNVSSDSIRSPIAGASAYIASKGALTGFSESAALEVKKRGVHVHVLFPGFVDTAMGRESLQLGMKRPPRAIVRSVEQVSAKVLAKMGGKRIEINAAPLTVVTPALKTFVPGLFSRMMEARAIPVD
jgi:NAD(P)-dependent dehydrogenase (short-subunit alcohol dehydrogenase family)